MMLNESKKKKKTEREREREREGGRERIQFVRGQPCTISSSASLLRDGVDTSGRGWSATFPRKGKPMIELSRRMRYGQGQETAREKERYPYSKDQVAFHVSARAAARILPNRINLHSRSAWLTRLTSGKQTIKQVAIFLRPSSLHAN